MTGDRGPGRHVRSVLTITAAATLFSVALITGLRMVAGLADEDHSCAGDARDEADSEKTVSSALADGQGWVEVTGMDFRPAGFIMRKDQIATFTDVKKLRPVPGEDHRSGRLDKGDVEPIRREIARGSTIAVQLVPSGDEPMHVTELVALRPDGSIRWLRNCRAYPQQLLDTFVRQQRSRGHPGTAVDLFRALVSKRSTDPNSPYRDLAAFEALPG